MNYLNHYLKFYSGENRGKFLKILFSLTEDIRSDNLVHMESLLTEDCIADISMIGKNITGKKNICNAMSFPVKDVNLRKVTLSNIVTRSHDCIAQQYAQLQCIFGYETDTQVFPFVFGGHICISYRKENEIWKISHIRFDLIYESGNNALVADHWKLIDYAIYSGHEPMINILYDSPWRVIPVDDEPMSEEAEAFDAMNRANIMTDGGDWDGYRFALSKDFTMDMSARSNSNKSNASTTDAKMDSVRGNVDWIKGKFHKEPHLQHVDNLISISFNEDRTEAHIRAFRSEFNRLYNDIYEKANVHSMAYTAIHDMLMVKEDGEWKLAGGTFIPHQEFRLVDDDCIIYDDYICGGKTWDEITK
jgi:hypothetical protein